MSEYNLNEAQMVININSAYESSNLFREITARSYNYEQCMGASQVRLGSGAIQIWMTPWTHVINGVKVVYLNIDGRFVDYSEIDKWVKYNCPNALHIAPDQAMAKIDLLGLNSVNEFECTPTDAQLDDEGQLFISFSNYMLAPEADDQAILWANRVTAVGSYMECDLKINLNIEALVKDIIGGHCSICGFSDIHNTCTVDNKYSPVFKSLRDQLEKAIELIDQVKFISD